MINAQTLAKCKKGVRIINCARGGIVDEVALLDAIKSKHVAGASLDTFEVEPPTDVSLELRMHPNVVVTPHLGASTFDAQDRVAKAIAENMSDIFDGGSFIGVVNAPDLGAVASQEHIVPYVKLAERIGSMQGQLLMNHKVGSVTINLRGKDVSDTKITDVIKSAVIKGVLSELGMAQISLINAITISEEIGLKVLVNMSEKTELGSGYVNSMSVDLELEGLLNTVRTIEGTVFGRNELRITSIDGFALDLPPSENMLLFNNYDAPGVLRRVVDKLSLAQVNIAHFSLGRKAKGKLAMSALVLDTPVPTNVFEELKEVGDIKNIVAIHLKEFVDPNFRVRNSNIPQVNVRGTSKPSFKPKHPEFSSGPCKKRPGWELSSFRTDSLGRSHRSKLGKARLNKAIEDTKRILEVPDDYLCGIVPASDTGAYEMAMWNMLGERPVDACYWESFGKGWNEDAVKHLKLKATTRQFTGNLYSDNLLNNSHIII